MDITKLKLTHVGLFQNIRLPFGLKNAPASFQRLLEHILQDILTFRKVFEDHLSHVAQVPQTLKTAHLKIRINKCQFVKNSVEFMGYLITRNSIADFTPVPERPPTLPLALASFTSQDASASQEKSAVVIPTTISSRHRHISCSA